MRLGTFVVVAAALLVPAAARAQAGSEEAEVMAVVEKLFDAMRARDTTAMRSVFVPGARLVRGSTATGETTVDMTDIGDFITSIANAPPGLLIDERIYDHEVRIDGNLATVWVHYTLYLGDRLSHCGVDAVQLLRLSDGWKMVNLADTMRRENCDPANN
jgi:hypothetical protein